MTSRGRTAPPPSQPASILKPSRTQTRPSKSQVNQTPSGKESRHKKTRQDSRPDQTTAASRRTLQTRRDGTVATRRREGKSGEGGDKLKTDNVWNKFLDDKDVVRAPTAETEETYVTSYVTGDSEDLSDSDDSEYTGSNDSAEGEEDEIDDSDDDRTIYSNYYLDHEYYEPESPPGPRAEIQEGTEYEACSCFPNRTDKNKGSMLYDKIKCKHTGLIGHTQPGVFKFNPYWNENMEIPKKTRKRDMSYPKMTFVFGYPKPQFEMASDSDDGGSDVSDYDDDYRDGTAGRGRTRSTKHSGSTYDSDDTGDSYDTHDDYSDSTDESDTDDDNQDYIPFQLPKIGIPKTPSLPPSSQSFRSRYSEYSDVPDSLPELPGSRQLTAVQTANSTRIGTTQRTQRTRQETRKSTRAEKTPRAAKTSKSTRKSARFSDSEGSKSSRSRRKRRTASRQSLPKGPEVSTTRTFQGKYYDPETKQVMLFDIGTQPGKRLPVGNIEPLYKPATVQPQPAQGKSRSADKDQETGSKPGSQDNNLEEPSQPAVGKLRAAVMGNLFIRSMLKNKNKAE